MSELWLRSRRFDRDVVCVGLATHLVALTDVPLRDCPARLDLTSHGWRPVDLDELRAPVWVMDECATGCGHVGSFYTS